MSLLILLVIGVLWTWGIHCLFSEGYILEPVGLVIEKAIGTWACKPLFLCPPCMSSVHGIIIFFWIVDLPWYNVFVYVICLTGINFIIKEWLYLEK